MLDSHALSVHNIVVGGGLSFGKNKDSIIIIKPEARIQGGCLFPFFHKVVIKA